MEINQANSLDAPPGIPVQKKRGRPRKDRSQNPGISPRAPRQNGQNQSNGGSAHAYMPPGFVRANGDQPRQDRADANGDDGMIGQVITGVVEATFDAGYLLSVRVGNSETSLRGVVFKPGHYVPVSSENDVAPHVQMIRRKEVPFPAKIRRRRGRQKRDLNLIHPTNGSSFSNQLAIYNPSQVPVAVGPAQAPPMVGARGTVVPVLLQPLNFSNGTTPATEALPVASRPAHLSAFNAKQVPSAQANPELQKSSPEGRPAGAAFEELVSEAAKRVQGSVDENENAKSAAVSTSNNLTSEQLQSLSQPLLIKPLQAIQSGFQDQPAPAGKMTELLLAVQKEKHMADSRHQDLNNPEK